MRSRRLLSRSAPLVFVLFIPVAYAADGAHDLLMKMSEAARALNYQGTFVYQHGDQLDSMRIAHKVQKGEASERLVSLNGAAREVIRNRNEVQCYLPDENSVMVEHRKLDARSFPAMVPQSIAQLDRHYIIALGSSGRVADHAVRDVLIRPKDPYRYGYQLWADRSTNLLLKATLVDDKGRVVEQFMFTDVKIGGKIPDIAFKPHLPGKDLVWHHEDSGVLEPTNADVDWKVEKLPPGFALTARVRRSLPARKTPVEHLVYSDGLAVVSVFVGKIEAGSQSDSINGPMHVGAVHVYGKVIGSHQITVVGEVPAVTVDMIGKSVVHHP